MTGTVIQQGAFISVGTPTTLSVVSGVDWIQVYNQSSIINNPANAGKAFYAQFLNGTILGTGYEWQNNAGATAVNLIAAPAGSFALANSSTSTPGAPVAITAISAANPPIVSTGSTTGLGTGSVVEIINTTGAKQFGGMRFTIDTVVTDTSFRLKYAPQIVAGTNGFYRIIPFDPIFYPRNRFITAITVGATTQIKMSVQTTYTVGQLVRVIVPPAYGAISQSINGLQGTILSIDAATNIATLNIDSTGFGAFVFPLTAATPFTQAQLAPIGAGTNPADATNLGDAVDNRAISGITLAPGVDGPGGSTGNTMVWTVGASFATNGAAIGGAAL